MNLKPRFIFHANAAAIGGRIARPKDVVIETSATSSLAAAGGRSRSKADNGSFGDVVRFGSASAFAEGLFDDVKAWAETLCDDELSEDTLTASMKVSSEIRDLAVNAKAAFTAKRITGGFSATSARASGEPNIRLNDDTAVEGAAVGGHKLIVEINTKLFQQYDTAAKLRTAVDDPKFVRESGAHLFIPTALAGPTTASPAGRLVESGGRLYGTIVKSIRWVGKPYPGAVIDQNTIQIPDCGWIYFGEILIGCLSRRLTMVRFDFCCPAPMRVLCCDSEDNGTWGV